VDMMALNQLASRKDVEHVMPLRSPGLLPTWLVETGAIPHRTIEPSDLLNENAQSSPLPRRNSAWHTRRPAGRPIGKRPMDRNPSPIPPPPHIPHSRPEYPPSIRIACCIRSRARNCQKRTVLHQRA
jgi:hypothetical protein